MKTVIQINGKDVEIILTTEQVAQINKQKQLSPDSFTLQDAMDYLGEEDEEIINLRLLQQVRVTDRILANQEAVCMVKAINEKHVFDWNNSDEIKWRIWWYLDKEFRFGDSSCSTSVSNVASSYCFKSEKLADSIGNNKNYMSICKRFMY